MDKWLAVPATSTYNAIFAIHIGIIWTTDIQNLKLALAKLVKWVSYVLFTGYTTQFISIITKNEISQTTRRKPNSKPLARRRTMLPS